jgi:hypothetical protein
VDDALLSKRTDISPRRCQDANVTDLHDDGAVGRPSSPGPAERDVGVRLEFRVASMLIVAVRRQSGMSEPLVGLTAPALPGQLSCRQDDLDGRCGPAEA